MPDVSVSCIVPVFNGERFLGEALESILAQTCRPLEIFVVDDGSTDGTAAVIEAFGERVTCIRQSRSGPAAARNAGVCAAGGAFLAFLDADDLWAPEKIALQLGRLQEASEIDLCFTRFQNFWVDELNDESRRYANHALAKPSAAWSICTLVARRTVFERFGPFDESLRGSENMTWFLRAAGLGARIDVLPGVLMRRRLHRDNLTRAEESLNYDQFFPILRAWRDYARTGRKAAGE